MEERKVLGETGVREEPQGIEQGYQMERMDKEAVGEYFPQIFESFANTDYGKFVFINNIAEDYSFWSKEAVEYFGLPAVQMENAGKIWLEHIAPEDRIAYQESIEKLFKGEVDIHNMVYRARNRSGRYITCSCLGRVIRDRKGEPKFFSGTIINHENRELIDPVTGLYNREMLLEQLENARIGRKPKHLWMMGIHNFFDINNRYGYSFGNKVLKAIAEYGRSQNFEATLYRPEGTKICTLSDMETYTDEQMKKCFLRTRDYCKKELLVEGIPISLDVYAVLMKVDDFSVEPVAIYNNTLYALDKAKQQNMRETFVIDSAIFSGNEKHLQIISEIRESILKNFEGFYLCYQPIVDAETGKPVGMEALIRWKNKKRGIIPPNEFIPWLEQDPIFYDLGNWILRQAVRDTKPLLIRYPEFVVNVNLAYPQIQREDFKAAVSRIIQEERFPADSLKLELTERCRLLDKDILHNEMAYFKSEGMQTALDDFGTGYAALNLLTELPVDQIKVDKSFVDNIMKDVPKQCLLRALTSCASELGKTVCVEGIETKELGDYLRANFRVSYFQGYYYSKPVPIYEFNNWMEEASGVEV